MKLCPVCGALAPDDSYTCPICGAVLDKEVKVDIPLRVDTTKKTEKVSDEKYEEILERIESLEEKLESVENLVWKLIFGIIVHFQLWEDIKEIYKDEGRKKEAQTIEKIKREFT